MDIDQTVRAAWNDTAPHDQWIVEIADDYVIVTDEKDRSFHRVPVLVGDSIEFGTPVKVAPGFVEVAASAPHRVVFASRAESRPDVAATVLDTPRPPLEQEPPNPIQPVEPQPPATPPTEDEPQTPPPPGGVSISPGAEPEQQVHTEPKEGPVPDMSELRSRLGLADDADEAAILAAVDALKSKADAPPQPSPEQVAASAATAKENDELRKEVTILASKVEQVTTELAATKAKEAAAVKASVLQAAQDLGKFAPAEREQWEKDYDEAPAAVTRLLDRIAAGAKVPVVAAGYTGTGEETGESFDDSEYSRFFGEKAGA